MISKVKSKFPKKLIRNFSLGVSSYMPKIPLDHQFPFAKSQNETKIVPSSEPIVKTLSNGILTAARETSDAVATIGLSVRPANQLESPDFYGRSDFITSMPFMSTKNTTTFAISQQLQRIGANVKADITRDGIFYSIEVLRSFLPTAMDILSDCIFNPSYLVHEVNNAKFEYANQLKKVTSEQQNEEDIHLAAFGCKGLGVPLKASRECLDKIDTKNILQFHKKLHDPSRVALSAVGVDPRIFADLSEQFFGKFQAEATKEGKDTTKYIGGNLMSFDKDNKKETFFTVAYKTVGWHHKDIPTICVLGSLMGGGSSFSVGGPGKGMYSRLYTRMVNENGLNSCSSVIHIHEEQGLFGITGSSDYTNAAHLRDSILKEAKEMANPTLLDNEAFKRAQNAALSTFLMNLENRNIVADDYSKQLLLYGKIISAEELKNRLMAVTKKDVLRVASEMLKTKPSIAMRGNTLD